MDRRLPPLNALRAFEAAARHRSFSRAGEELSVTPGAISHQVKHLEDCLGVRLFVRTGQSLSLTEEAQAALPLLRDGFDMMASAVDAIRSVDQDKPLVVRAAPSLTAKWLMPRLHRFCDDHQDIPIEIEVARSHEDAGTTDADVAIEYALPRESGLCTQMLFQDSLIIVAARSLVDEAGGALAADDLAGYTLLYDNEGRDDPDRRPWPGVLGDLLGIEAATLGRRALRFNRACLAVDAALDGRGIAVTSSLVAHNDLVAGRLVRLFAAEQRLGFGYNLVIPTSRAHHPRVRTFRRWLEREAAATSLAWAAQEGQPGEAAPAAVATPPREGEAVTARSGALT